MFGSTLKTAAIVSLLVSQPSVDQVTIEGPGQVEVRELTFFDLKGLPAEFRDLFRWKVFGPPGAIARDMADRQGNPVMVFQAKVPGNYAIIGDVNMPPDTFELISHTFVVGGQPNPNPDPNPDPDPNPKPDPNPTPAVTCVIIEETMDRVNMSPQRAMIFGSKKIRVLFPKGAFHLRDDDIENPTNDMKLYINRARELGLPAIFLVDENGKVLHEGAVPKDVPETIKLIQRYKEN